MGFRPKQPTRKFKGIDEFEKWIKDDPKSLGFHGPPDPNCPDCYGRGHRGINITTKAIIACGSCLKYSMEIVVDKKKE